MGGKERESEHCSHLSCDKEVCQHSHGSAIAPEVGDRLHDIPGVLPPGQPSKEAKGQ